MAKRSNFDSDDWFRQFALARRSNDVLLLTYYLMSPNEIKLVIESDGMVSIWKGVSFLIYLVFILRKATYRAA